MENQAIAATDLSRDAALISARTIQGTPVFNPAGDALGHIDDVMIDAQSGRVVYGVLEFGGFLGIGSGHHAIPFGTLRYDAAKGGYVTDLTREALDNAPEYTPDWYQNREWQQRAHEYYGIAPYWI